LLAAPLHVMVLCWLAFRLQWNYSVCPWNAAIAVAGFTLIWPWRATLWADWRAASRPIKAAVAFVFLSPLLFYVALLDPFLCYCVYTEDTPLAWIVQMPPDVRQAVKLRTMKVDHEPDSGTSPNPGIVLLPDAKVTGISDLRPGLEVAIPPEHRLFEACFEQMAQPGDTLIIEDRRLWARLLGFGHREITKPADSTVVH
jgi:hypothetical protein